jgi:diguanylate cyclase (GGDEF)-like protein/PAS domain S-box-containing protein
MRAVVPEPAPVIEWTVGPDGVLAFRGPALQILGALPGSDLHAEMEALLAPILIVVRSATGWDDYQLERTLDTSAGRRRLLIRCRQQHDGTGGHVGVIMNAATHAEVEENLGDLIERYRLLVEISPDMIVVHQDGILRYINPTGVGWMEADEASELIGRPLTDFVAAGSIPALLERIAQLDRPGAVSSPTEMTIMTLAGQTLLLESQSVRTMWDGRPAFQVFLRDHSERRRAEAALRHQANLLASVSDAVVATDLEGRITGWNPAAADLYRLGGPEALGRNVKDVLGDDATTATGDVRAGEVHHVRADGTTVAVRVAVAPLRDEIGRHSGEVAVCADQSYRLLAAAERELAETRFTTVVTALSEGIIVMEADGTITSMNPAARRIFGDRDSAGSNGLQVLARHRLVDDQGAALPKGHDPISVTVATGVAAKDRIIGIDDDQGGRRWLSVSCETLERRPDGVPASIMCSMTDITDRRAGEELLTYAAAHDSLTGLANRSQLLNVLGECVSAGIAASVLFVDLDRFKTVNDAHGHLAGDRVLCAVASRIRRQVDRSATVGRLAGDEFVVVMPGVTEQATAGTAQLIRESIAQPIRLADGREVLITASIGIAGTAANEDSAQALLSDADMAMYRAKQRGRSRIETFDGALRAAMSRRVDLADRLGKAITDHHIAVHYQPLIRMDTGLTLGYEALARWTDLELGPVPPVEFIPVAEDHGLIVALGRSVLLQACRQAATWQPGASGHGPDVSVNLSAHQLVDPQLPADILAILALSGLAPERLVLEVTESVLMNDVTASIAVLDDLRAAGVRLVIDDFGTGYSSLSYLRRLPVDGIKIDRSFVSELGLGTGDDAIVDAIIQLGHSLSLTITAEGVETAEQAAILRQLGCDTAQGYLYGRPSEVASTFTGYVADGAGRPWPRPRIIPA